MIKVSLKHIRAWRRSIRHRRRIQEKIDYHYKESMHCFNHTGVKGEASTLIAEMGVDMGGFE